MWLKVKSFVVQICTGEDAMYINVRQGWRIWSAGESYLLNVGYDLVGLKIACVVRGF